MGGSDWDDPGPCSHCAADDVKVVKTVDRVHFHCEQCRTHQPVEIEPLKADDLNPYAWGSIVCKRCHFVIATMSAETPGRLVFVPKEEASEATSLLRDLFEDARLRWPFTIYMSKAWQAAREYLTALNLVYENGYPKESETVPSLDLEAETDDS